MLILAHRFLGAEIGDLERERQGRVVESEGTRPRDCAGHIRHAIMNDSVDLIDRIGMGGRVAGLEASALVDGDVDEDRAALHCFEHLARNELGRCRARDQYRADNQLGFLDGVGDRRA